MSSKIDYPRNNTMSSKIDYPRNDTYRRNFLEALEPWEKGLHVECVKVARYNLTDPTLPRYFQIKNLILIVSSEHDWAAAEQRRLEAERVYSMSLSLTKKKEVAELQALAALREELDDLRKAHGENPQLYDSATEVLAKDLTKNLTGMEIQDNESQDGKMDDAVGGDVGVKSELPKQDDAALQ